MPIPKSFSVVYESRNGTVPPPHHFEIAIRLEPGKPGVYEFRPGYPGMEAGIRVWKETFPVSDAARAALYERLVKLGVERVWKADPNPPVGGGSRNLTVVTAKGKFVVPAFPVGADRARAEKLFAAVEALVPRKLEAEFRQRFAALENSKKPRAF